MKGRYLLPGDTILYANIDEFLSKIQHKVLGTNLSHSSKIYSQLKDTVLELEADVKVRLHTYSYLDDDIDLKHREIYRWNPQIFRQDLMNEVLEQVRKEFEGELYGFVQWPTIGIRRLLETILPGVIAKRVRSWHILYKWGVSCSELLHVDEQRILDIHIEYYKKNQIEIGYERAVTYMQDMKRELERYNKDIFTPEDLRVLYDQFPILIWRIA